MGDNYGWGLVALEILQEKTTGFPELTQVNASSVTIDQEVAVT